jgi:2-C-methyl-D-erythritol 2,4-cyclodiphosphate synthase
VPACRKILSGVTTLGTSSARVGIGYDIHRFAEGRKLFLGGIDIPHSRGLLGHSDGDVLLHAIADAVLGAVSAEDIGTLFPDTDENLRGIESGKILARARELVQEKGFSVVNVDAVIVAEEPKIGPHKERIRQNVARILGVEPDRVGLKGKTAEKLGAPGRGEAIEVYAVALLEKAR